MILRRDPIHVLTLAVGALAVVSGAAVCVMGWQFWRYERGGPWSWLAVYFAGIVMVLTWVVIVLSAEPPPGYTEVTRPIPQEDKPRTFPQLPPDGYQTIVRFEPEISWPNIRPGKLYRAFTIIRRDGELSVSVDKMKEGAGLNEIETRELRGWWKRRGLAEDHRRGVRLIGDWRGEIDYLLPHLDKLRKPARKSYGQTVDSDRR